ncbi:type II toxin-antitoxin system HipA family toxin [Cellulomonas sp. SLBN-39]|uniref:type II toxin-antitoxin system HipA family toxin n=1 Tax=Cellulomonas sp. SLBN-39 TaxID=2768446 RepID=UPI001172198F|nr:type II toxin-antitoxin system HipA family toxin [Cellulomonas sp. SLBN-39]TQL02971.1 serine/threonine-protein kinase HipA [Cellulomonas sp. SLBN-39]
MSAQRLAVLLYGKHVADLEQTTGGQHLLHYREDPGTTPLSLSLPLGGGPFKHQRVRPFLEGLLPERQAAREAMARELEVSARNPFALLTRIGLDCAGAVQFCAESEITDVLARTGTVEPLTEREIAQRLRVLRTDPGATWLAPRERWSLAGAQAKFALRHQDGHWYEATGAEPTTHIVKPGVDGFRLQALNEHISLQTARRAGLAAARSDFRHFGDEPALVVQRYDRRPDRSGRLTRLHQEDLCQATSTYPGDKYESDGGPRAVHVVDLLRRHSTRAQRENNLDRFVDALAFNVLIQAPDAHAKNYSILLLDGTVRLAPLYDVASGAPYDATEQRGLRQAAMAIGGRRDFAEIDTARWERFAREAHLDPDRVTTRVHDLASRIPDAMSDAFAAESGTPGIDELRSRMLDPVVRSCRDARSGR